MPIHLQGNTSQVGSETVNFMQMDFDYDYPSGHYLRPGTNMHDFIRDMILQYAQDSLRAMNPRYPSWNEIDRTLTSFMPLNVKEKKMFRIDKRKPIPIVVPLTYANLETLQTYSSAAMLQEPMMQFEGNGPEDVYGAILLERLVQMQNRKAKNAMAIDTMIRDAYAYGMGITHCIWQRRTTAQRLAQPITTYSEILGADVIEREAGELYEKVMFEGNVLENIDVYRYLPDPSVAAHNIQEGGFVGWSDPETRTNLLNREQWDESLFNCRYLNGIQDGRSSVVREQSSRWEKAGVEYRNPAQNVYPVDVIWMYIDLIPALFGPEGRRLGDSYYPEKWVFALAADRIVIAAQPVNLNHGMYPVTVATPNMDGYSVSPISELEITYGLQNVADFMFNSHSMNVRKALNDMFVIDPALINVRSLREPGPGKLIYLKRSQWAMGKIDAAIKQFQVTDVTQNNMRDLAGVKSLTEDVMGTQGGLRGDMPGGNRERVTAQEVRGANSGSLRRLQMKTRRLGYAMQDLATMMAYNTQQFMSEETYVKVAGRLEAELIEEMGEGYQGSRGRVAVKPMDLEIAWDIIEHDGSFPGDATAQEWLQLYQIVAGNEGLTATFNMVNIFKHLARLLGARNISDFVAKGGTNVQPVLAEPEAVQNGVSSGNLVPVGGANGL